MTKGNLLQDIIDGRLEFRAVLDDMETGALAMGDDEYRIRLEKRLLLLEIGFVKLAGIAEKLAGPGK